MPKTSSELRAFVFGAVFGIIALMTALHTVSYVGGIKWQPVKIETR